MDLFLQVFDEGRITDSKGRLVDARNAIFIMTSNIGAGAKVVHKPIGFHAGEAACNEAKPEPMDDELKQHFRTELINRIDEVIRFNPLSTVAMEAIALRLLEEIADTASKKYGRSIRFDEGVAAHLGENAYSPEYGARNLKRMIQEEVELPLVRWLSDAADGDSCRCVWESGGIRFCREG